ncbi:hypothetical protein ACWDA3_04045 [Nonomuraea rubra]
MMFRTRTRRAAAATGALLAVLALGASPAQADGASGPCGDANVVRTPQNVTAATVVRTPQKAMVLADGESGTKRPV